MLLLIKNIYILILNLLILFGLHSQEFKVIYCRKVIIF